MSQGKNSFVCYVEWLEAAALLPTEEQAAFIGAVIAFLRNGAIPQGAPASARALLTIMAARIGADSERYTLTKERRKAAASKRWAQADANACNAMQDASAPQRVHIHEHVHGHVYVHEVAKATKEEEEKKNLQKEKPAGQPSLQTQEPVPLQKAQVPTPAKQTTSQAFELFWKAYPNDKGRKHSKSQCYEKWKREGLDDHLQEVLNAVAYYRRLAAEDAARGNDHGMCAPLVFLNQQRWASAPEQPSEEEASRTAKAEHDAQMEAWRREVAVKLNLPGLEHLKPQQQQ